MFSDRLCPYGAPHVVGNVEKKFLNARPFGIPTRNALLPLHHAIPACVALFAV